MAALRTAVVLSPAALQEERVECAVESAEVRVSGQGKERVFQADLCMGPQEVAVSSKALVEELNWRGGNIGFVTYGPRDSGKSSLLFAEGGLTDTVLTNLFDSGTALALSLSEVVYTEAASTETWQDLLNPDNTAPYQVHIEVGSAVEAKAVLELAQSRSGTWASGRVCPSRGHLLLDIAILGEVPGHVYVLDLAGFQPAKLTTEQRAKLPGEQQLMFTRMGLLQLRAYCRNLAEGKEREANHRFKVISLFERILTASQVLFVVCLRADCPFTDACSALELLEVVHHLPRLTLDSVPLSLRPFPDIHTSDSSEKVYESPLKTFASSHTVLSQSQDEDTQDWLSAFDAKLGRLLARRGSRGQSQSVSLYEGKVESGGMDEEEGVDLQELREQCAAMRNVTQANKEEEKALARHIARLEEELEAVRQATGSQLEGLKRANEALASDLGDLTEVKGAEQLQDVFREDFQALETHLNRQNEQISVVRGLYEVQPTDRIHIRQLTNLEISLNSEAKAAENELKSLQRMSRKWDMAEKCYHNVKNHLHSLEGDLVSLEEKLSRQESKSQRLMQEIQQERAKAAELTQEKLRTQSEAAKLTLVQAHQRHIVVLKSTPNASVSTSAGSGSLVRDIRELQDGLRKAGSQVPAACQLMEQGKALIEDLRKARVRVKNLASKVQKLSPTAKTQRGVSSHVSADSSFARLPKFSFS